MLLIINLQDKSDFLFRSFIKLWKDTFVECQICYEKIENDGEVAITDNGSINLEKMFHSKCITRWRLENTRDPFNRNVKFWFNFPPKNQAECSALVNQIKKFIGDNETDKKYGAEFKRVNEESCIDVDIDFTNLLHY
ncbi:ac53-like protein [Cryptophlebia peltastica nucleopolyhedrovirus]|uniref:Ac53-like protein n=1 Tax=Cryptophlebia peltastica nucleopolyhedrovirus TaxID=2304025 RepID=A0A346RNQ6_9ABAC|nr:ac53-like protein [Cryptophlebia peltastica nucleopolyhedrovirus]AXS67703.1 ac53-like protein [Cryptophlebia peltastica nucleopolyhedrovirus]